MTAADPLRLLWFADTAAIHLGLSLVAGALAGRRWLWRASSAWAASVSQRLMRLQRQGAALMLVAGALGLWLEAVVMGDAAFWRAGPTAVAIVRSTHYGHAWMAGMAAAALTAWASRGGRWLPAAVGVAAFALSRGVVSHAAEAGDFSVDVAIDWLHLVFVGVWVGIVWAGAALALPDPEAPKAARTDAVRWVVSLSGTATVALVLIVLTGTFKAWRMLPMASDLWETSFGQTLLVKLAIVAAAAALGAINRWRVMPGLLAGLQAIRGGAGASDAVDWRHRLRRILHIEAALLLLALVAAAVLAGGDPPDVPTAMHQASRDSLRGRGSARRPPGRVCAPWPTIGAACISTSSTFACSSPSPRPTA